MQDEAGDAMAQATRDNGGERPPLSSWGINELYGGPTA